MAELSELVKKDQRLLPFLSSEASTIMMEEFFDRRRVLSKFFYWRYLKRSKKREARIIEIEKEIEAMKERAQLLSAHQQFDLDRRTA